MSKHISEQYDLELSAIRNQLMAMGGLVEQQVADAGLAYFTHDMPLAEDVRTREKRLNAMEVELDDDCVAIIARRQPAASDLRQVVGVMKAITDLERVGDEANRIAKMAIKIIDQDIPSHQYGELRAMHAGVIAMLTKGLDAFARLNADIAAEVISADEEIDAAYNAIIDRCSKEMSVSPHAVQHLLSTIWVARSLERIGDHAKNMCEYVIFQVLGHDVRHQAKP